ncbi:MAG: M42 family metallopeptidase [Anaerolineae bacterium]|jgi:putative aminopeptidase FrvX|nr:M42 family metallopeptidase [Anaerolineae bacterium]
MVTIPAIPVPEMLDFLTRLLRTPSPTGDTEAALTYVQASFADLPVSFRYPRKGGLVFTWEGDAARPRALTAHVDTLGAMVQRIKGDGRLVLTPIGSFDWHSVETEGCTVLTGKGLAYRGSILPVKASVHIYGPEARQLERVAENYEVRLDATVFDEEDTLELGIRPGDFVAFDPRMEVNAGFVRSRHLDDKAGVACIYGALLALYRADLAPHSRLEVLISGYEEVGHGAATGIPADTVELVAVDMAAAGDMQNSDEFSVGICAKDSGGPYHLGLRRQLEALSEAHAIPYRTDIYPFYGSDGEVAWRAGADLKVALIGPGVDASHSYERTHTDSLEATARLIAAYLLSE